MASQTPGAIRAEVHGSSMTHQMAAGDAQVTHPRFDAHHQRDVQQHQSASIGGLSPHDIPPPHSSDYAQGIQNQTQYRSPMAASIAPSTLPPFVSQKTTADPVYALQYATEQANANSIHQPRQNYAIEPAGPPIEPHHRRPGSSGSSVDSNNGAGSWPAMYTMHPVDQQRPSSHPHHLPHPQQRLQQPSVPISPYPTLAPDMRSSHLFHVTATM